LRQQFIGRTMPILLENETKPGYLSGHTPNFLPVWVPAGSYKPNDLIDVQLLRNTPDGLEGI